VLGLLIIVSCNSAASGKVQPALNPITPSFNKVPLATTIPTPTSTTVPTPTPVNNPASATPSPVPTPIPTVQLRLVIIPPGKPEITKRGIKACSLITQDEAEQILGPGATVSVSEHDDEACDIGSTQTSMWLSVGQSHQDYGNLSEWLTANWQASVIAQPAMGDQAAWITVPKWKAPMLRILTGKHHVMVTMNENGDRDKVEQVAQIIAACIPGEQAEAAASAAQAVVGVDIDDCSLITTREAVSTSEGHPHFLSADGSLLFAIPADAREAVLHIRPRGSKEETKINIVIPAH
jgi:hypothetical protein